MKRVSMFAVPILFLLFLVVKTNVVSHAANEVVERPIYSEGDFWIFIDGKGGISKWSFLREEKDKYLFSKNGTEAVKDFSLMDVSKAGGFPGPIIKFPLKIGNWWNHEFTVESTKGAGPGHRIARYEVADFEKITVPAGTFQAFKITVAIEALVSGKKGSRALESATYWYAPDVKQIIKAEKGELLWELKDYKIK